MEEKKLTKFRIRDEAEKSKIENMKSALKYIERYEIEDDFKNLIDEIEKENKELYEEILKDKDYLEFERRMNQGEATEQEIRDKIEYYKNRLKKSSENIMEKPKLRPEDWEAETEVENIAEQRAQAGLEFMEKGAKRTKEGRLNITPKQWEAAHKEMEKKIGKKKEEVGEVAQEGVEKVEKAEGSVMEIKEAKQAGESLKTAESKLEGELKSTVDLVMERYKTEEKLKEKQVEREIVSKEKKEERDLKSSIDIAMEKYKPEEKVEKEEFAEEIKEEKSKENVRAELNKKRGELERWKEIMQDKAGKEDAWRSLEHTGSREKITKQQESDFRIMERMQELEKEISLLEKEGGEFVLEAEKPVNILRSSGEIEKDWTILNFDEKTGFARVIKSINGGRAMIKEVKIEDLKKWNTQPEKESVKIDAEKKYDKAELEKEISSAESFEELSKIIEKSGGIQGTQDFFDLKKLNEIIGKVRSGEIDVLHITRSGGLRNKVEELLRRPIEEKAETRSEAERLREDLDKAREKFALVRPKVAKTEAEIFAETLEKKGGLSPFGFGKKFVGEKPEISAEYEEIRKNYEVRRDAMKNFLIDTKKATLEKRGLAPEEIEKELDKYAREYIAPHFAAFEAAKIQSAREEANPSFVEKMKDNKISKVAYDAIDKYRKASFKDKMLISVGLVGTGLAAGVFGGTFGSLIAGGAAVGKIGQRVLGTAGTAVGAEALTQKIQQKWLEKEGWGKNRKEYILKELNFMRERARKGKISAEITQKEGTKEIEKLLDKRRELLKKLETKRTVIGASVGLLVGTGIVFRGVRYLGDIVGINERLSDFFSYKGEMPKMPAVEARELPVTEIEALHIDAAKENIEHLEGLAEHPAEAPNISESENMIYNLVDQDKVAEYEQEMKPYIDTIVGGLEEEGFSVERIMEQQEEIVNSVIAEMKIRGITIDASALNAENLQGIMDSSEGKMGAIISKLANIEQRDLNSIIARMGGWDKFMNSNASMLFEPEGGPIDISLSKFGMELKRLTGDAPSLYGAASIKEILKSINSKEIFGGSAKELIEKGM